MEEHFGPFQLHVPQQSRRDKLRVTNDEFHPPHHNSMLLRSDLLNLPPPSTSPSSLHDFNFPPHFNSISSSSSLNLSLGGAGTGAGSGGQLNHIQSPTATPNAQQQKWRGVGGGASASASATPVGPFTGYASILSRSRFLKPAQELLEDFCNRYRGGERIEAEDTDIGRETRNATASILLEDSSSSSSSSCAGAWSWSDAAAAATFSFTDRYSSSTLLSMLNEVYRRYRLYCQQMHSAVTSFETVAGLGNAAPFLCFAIKAMSKHFHCIKNAILDHIHITNKAFRSGESRKSGTPGFCSSDPVLNNHKHVGNPSFLQHPVWRSQRGFPDKAVAVLRTWLFENFLHPYPTDSDKQMLAQRTGLSRNQVSNWFTNARVRLWKPMVEEIHTLEKRAQITSDIQNQRLDDMLANRFSASYQPLETSPNTCFPKPHQDDQGKIGRMRLYQVSEQNKEPLSMHCNNMSSNQLMAIGAAEAGRFSSNGTALGSSQDNQAGISWATNGQGLPFWLAKQ